MDYNVTASYLHINLKFVLGFHRCLLDYDELNCDTEANKEFIMKLKNFELLKGINCKSFITIVSAFIIYFVLFLEIFLNSFQ